MATITKTFTLGNTVITIKAEEIAPAESQKPSQSDSDKKQKRRAPVNWDQELQWFQENRWVFEKYKGTWVAVKGNKLVAHDTDYQKLRNFCKEKNIKDPFMQYIPKSEHEWSIGSGNYRIQ